MKAQKLEYNYNDIKVMYNEDTDKWHFILRGRERSVDTLTKAKEAIDAPPPEKKKPFMRIECWKLDRWGDEADKVTVTSIADSPSWRDNSEVWVQKETKLKTRSGTVYRTQMERSKENAATIYPVNDNNDAVVATLLALRKERNELDAKIEKVRDKLQPLDLSKNE